MNTPTFIFPAILGDERDDGSVSAYIDAAREESGCSMMEAIRTLVNNLNAVYNVRRMKLAKRLYRDPATTFFLRVAVGKLYPNFPVEEINIRFIAGTQDPQLFVESGDPGELEIFVTGVEWLLSQPNVAPLVTRLEPSSVPPII